MSRPSPRLGRCLLDRKHLAFGRQREAPERQPTSVPIVLGSSLTGCHVGLFWRPGARWLASPVDEPLDPEVSPELGVADVADVQTLAQSVASGTDDAVEATALVRIVRATTDRLRAVLQHVRAPVVEPRKQAAPSGVSQDPALAQLLIQEPKHVALGLPSLRVRHPRWGSDPRDCAVGGSNQSDGGDCSTPTKHDHAKRQRITPRDDSFVRSDPRLGSAPPRRVARPPLRRARRLRTRLPQRRPSMPAIVVKRLSQRPNPRPRPGHMRAAFSGLCGGGGVGGKRLCACPAGP